MDGIRPSKPNKTELDRIIPSGPNWTKKGCFCFSYKRILRGYLVFKNPSLFTPHLIFITHHSITHHLQLKYHNFLRWHIWHLFPILITQKNMLFVGPTDWFGAAFTSYFFFFFFFFPSTPNTQTHRT